MTIPTWNAYNSLISKERKPTIIQFLTFSPCPPTNWLNLYCVLKQVQGLATSTTLNLKTIVTLDLQFYDNVCE